MTSQLTGPQITSALEAGIISRDQAASMRAELQSKKTTANVRQNDLPNQSTIGHEDNMRFLRSFSDVFIAIGLILLALGVLGLTHLLGGGVLFIGAAGLMWVGAEYFGRKKRAHLPSLIIALSFLMFSQRGFAALLGGGGSLAALVTLGVMALFYWRVRLPFCIALIAASALFLLFSLLAQFAPSLTKNNLGVILGLSGLVIFSAALAYDTNDQHRTTRFADNAFWLHFLAAPLIIHGMAITGVALKTDKLFGIVPIFSLDSFDAIIVLLIISFLTLIGLAINRRALIVSALGYTGFAITSLFMAAGTGVGTSLIFTLIILGGVIVFLGVGWHEARKLMLAILPKWRIFPPPFDPNFKA
ncbi:MAG: hypothetical protein ABJG88_05865 [Litorimonas sp.]